MDVINRFDGEYAYVDQEQSTMTKPPDQFQPHILIKPPHKYPNLEFSKGHQRGSSGKLG